MALVNTDIRLLETQIKQAMQSIEEAYTRQPRAQSQRETRVPPPALSQAMDQFIEVLKRADADISVGKRPQPHGLDHQDIGQIGEYGSQLLDDAQAWVELLRVSEAGEALAQVHVPLALWVARCGGTLSTLEPVVDALARLANTTSRTGELIELAGIMTELLEAVAPSVAADLDQSNPGRPWRVLNLNRGIVATRSLDPAIMERVFEDIVKRLPGDAPAFFREGMQQMEALNYPGSVRAVMQRYFERYGATTLH